MSKTAKEKNWKRENLLLEQQAQQNLCLKEEINKEITIDNHIQVGFYEQVFRLKEDASLLTKKLQKQKHKNNQLGVIIKHVRQCIDKQKGIPTSREKSNTDQQLDDYQRKVIENITQLKRIQTDLAQFSGKSNQNAAKVTMKKLQINASRTQRVIDEGIFRNLEKELRQKQFQFKKLLIEKINQRKKEEDIMKQYQQLALKLQQIKKNELSNQNQILSKKDDNFHNETFYKPSIDNKKFTMLKNSISDRKLSFTLRKKQVERKADRNQYYEFLVKKAMIEVGCDNPSQLFEYVSSKDNETKKTKLQVSNEKLFEILNELEDIITHTKEKINEAEQQKKSKKIMYYTKTKQPSKDEQRQKAFILNKNILKQKENQIKSLENEFNTFLNHELFSEMLDQLSLQHIDSSIVDSQNIKLQILSQKLKDAEKQIHKYFIQPCPESNEVIIKNNNPFYNEHKQNFQILKKHKSQSLMNGSPQKLQDLLSKIKKVEQCDRILKKDEFRKQYKMLTKNSSPSFQNLPKIISKKNQEQRRTIQHRK